MKIMWRIRHTVCCIRNMFLPSKRKSGVAILWKITYNIDFIK